MKKTLKLIFTLILVFSLGGCEIWTIIWDGIAGKGYYQVTRSTIAAKSASLATADIALGTLTTSAVIIYKTHLNGYYGKLSFTSSTDTSLTFIYTTYANDGTVLKSSNGVTIAVGETIDLETGVSAGAAGDFTFSTGQTLTPANGASFYVFST